MTENNLIIYYSWVGNTEVVAKEIQNQTRFDIYKIEEKKERKFGSIMKAAMGAFFGYKSRLKSMDFSMKDYENIYLGAQVWAGKTTPAINKFLSKACFKYKKVWLFVTKGDENEPQKVYDSITKRIEKKGGQVVDRISITTQWDPKTNIPMVPHDVKDFIHDWLHKKQEIK
ncbi:MAG: hypothetical protein ABH890_03490 [Bacillota bacterium]